MSAHPRLSINQATIKYAPFDDALALTAAAGVSSIGLWREPVAELGLAEAAERLNDSGLRFSSLCRAGFFTMAEGQSRRDSIDDNRRAIVETATMAAAGADGSAAVLVLVAGGLPEGSTGSARSHGSGCGTPSGNWRRMPPRPVSRWRSNRCTRCTPPTARSSRPSDRRSTSRSSSPTSPRPAHRRSASSSTPSTSGGTPSCSPQIARAGAGARIASYQVCDWATPLESDVLLSRHYPGDGVIDFAGDHAPPSRPPATPATSRSRSSTSTSGTARGPW